jgi:hypothetical protein
MWIKSQAGELLNAHLIGRVFVSLESEPGSHRVMANLSDGKFSVLAEASTREAAAAIIEQIRQAIEANAKFLELT